MPIRFKCTHCGCDLSMPDGSQGKSTHCSFCQQGVVVPGGSGRSGGGSSTQMRGVGSSSSKSLPAVGPKSNKTPKSAATPSGRLPQNNRTTVSRRDDGVVNPPKEPMSDPSQQMYLILGGVFGFVVLVMLLFLFSGGDDTEVAKNNPPPPPPVIVQPLVQVPVAKVEPKKVEEAPKAPPKIDGQVTAWPSQAELERQILPTSCLIMADRSGARTFAAGAVIHRAEQLIVTHTSIINAGANYFVYFPRLNASGKAETRSNFYFDAASSTGLPATMAWKSTTSDLVIFKIPTLPKDVPAVMMGSQTSLAAGSRVFSVAGVLTENDPAPSELFRIVPGTVQPEWANRGSNPAQKYIETKKETNDLVVGSPLYDDVGTLVGLHTPKAQADDFSDDIDVSDVRAVLFEYARTAKINNINDEIRFPGLATPIIAPAAGRKIEEIVKDLTTIADPSVKYRMIGELYSSREIARAGFQDILKASVKLNPGERRPVLALMKQIPTGLDETSQLAQLLNEAEPTIRSLILIRYEQVKDLDKASVQAISKLLTDVDPTIRSRAIRLLSKGSPEELKSFVTPIARALADWDSEVVVEALQRLATIGPDATSAKAEMLNCVRNKDPNISKAAQQALAKLGKPDPRDVDELQKFLTDENEKIRQFALIQLSKLGIQASTLLPDLLKLLSSSDLKTEKALAMSAIAEIGELAAEKALPVFMKLVTDPDPEIGNLARESLPKFGRTSRTLNLLLDINGYSDEQAAIHAGTVFSNLAPLSAVEVEELVKRLGELNARQIDTLIRLFPQEPKFLLSIKATLKKWLLDVTATSETRELVGSRLLLLDNAEWLTADEITTLLTDANAPVGPKRIASKMLLQSLRKIRDPKELKPFKTAVATLKPTMKKVLETKNIEPGLELLALQLLLEAGEASGSAAGSLLRLHGNAKLRAETEEVVERFDDELTPALVLELKNANSVIRLSAVRLLGRIGKDGATINRLSEVSGNRREEDEIRNAAKEAIEQINKRRKK